MEKYSYIKFENGVIKLLPINDPDGKVVPGKHIINLKEWMDENPEERKKLGWIRYITFAVSLIFVATLFLVHVGNIEKIMFWAFIIGNVLYYAVGIILAYAFKDNRAFCKYICPVTVFLKPMSYYSLVRVKCDKEKCISCGKCRRVCPMNVDVTDNSRKRENGTECILCMECVKNCPKGAL